MQNLCQHGISEFYKIWEAARDISQEGKHFTRKLTVVTRFFVSRSISFSFTVIFTEILSSSPSSASLEPFSAQIYQVLSPLLSFSFLLFVAFYSTATYPVARCRMQRCHAISRQIKLPEHSRPQRLPCLPTSTLTVCTSGYFSKILIHGAPLARLARLNSAKKDTKGGKGACLNVILGSPNRLYLHWC